MQGLDWDDLRHILAVARHGSFAPAAASLKVDATTVARRLRAAEGALGAKLFERLPDGTLHPTRAGEIAAVEAEMAEAAIGRLTEAVTGADAMTAGTVRVTAVPILVSRVLVPASVALTRRHPGLALKLLAEPRGANLIRREADLALRLARPSADVDGTVLARRIGHLAYAVYAPAESQGDGTAALPWIGYDDTMAALPQARWLAQAGRHDGVASVALNDADSIVGAIRAGLGRSLLPRSIGDGITGLRRIAAPGGLPSLPEREIWLLTHPNLRHLARIAIVTAWLEQTVRELGTERDDCGSS